MARQPLTIINDKNMRGIIASASTISETMLEDLVDLIEMSSPQSVAEDNRRIKEADDAGSWIPFDNAKTRAKKAR